jgi:hypothetical protein
LEAVQKIATQKPRISVTEWPDDFMKQSPKTLPNPFFGKSNSGVNIRLIAFGNCQKILSKKIIF